MRIAMEPAYEERSARPPVHWSRLDTALVVLGFALSFAISLWLGRGHILWEDEMLGWVMLRDPSWHHMLASWRNGADGGGIAFYITGRAWFRVFGASIAAFRLYSATSFAIAFAIAWAAARRFYRTGPVAFAMFVTWFFCPVLVSHMAEGRFYGLLMASVAGAVYLYVRGAEIPSTGHGRAPGRLCLAVFAVHAVLTTSHLLGVVYSCFLVAATAAMDGWQGRLRPRLYLSAMAAWLLLLPSRASIHASAQVGKPHFWTKQPDLPVFLVAYTGFSLRIAALLLLLAAGVVATAVLSRQRRGAMAASVRTRRPVYVLLAAMFLVPIAFFLEGTVGPALFIDRYLIPVNIGVMFALAELITLLDFPALLRPRVWKPALAVVVVIVAALMGQYDFAYVGRYIIQHGDYTAALTARLPTGIPVLCEDVFSFTELMGRQRHSGVEYTYFLDWQNSIDPKTPRTEVTQYHLMENWKKSGYFSDAIVYRDAFLREHPYFLVLHTDEFAPGSLTRSASSRIPRTLWLGDPLVERFAADPNYQVKPYTRVEAAGLVETVYLVCRKGFEPCDLGEIKAHA